jgi:hypothetical protein
MFEKNASLPAFAKLAILLSSTSAIDKAMNFLEDPSGKEEWNM